MSLLANSNAIESGGYNIDRSLRFRSSASAYLSRTPSVAGNRQTWTWSGWVKRGKLGANATLLWTQPSGAMQLDFTAADQLELYQYNAGYQLQLVTNRVFRDPSAWYHILCIYDSTNATTANRIRFYINGVQETSFATANYPTANYSGYLNGASLHGTGGSATYFDGYLSEVNFIDGQALTPSSFGQTDAVTGVWVPKKYTGTYGTNGFYLDFKDNTSATTLAYDKSGNGNNWTPNNISTTAGATYDSMTDVPTLTSATAANFAVWNPLDKRASATSTFADGNLAATVGASASTEEASATITFPSSGSWYCEITCSNVASGNARIGIGNSATSIDSRPASGYLYQQDGQKYVSGSASAYGASYTTGDVIGIAFDSGAGSLTFYKNNASQGAITGISTSTVWIITATGKATVWTANFGQRPFAYTAPSGFKALCTQNLPTPTIGATSTTQAGKYFNTVLYTGDSATSRSLTGVGFQPDLVWNKSRSNAYSNWVEDSVRGASKVIATNSTDAEVTDTAFIKSFDTDGFTVGNSAGVNANGATYVAWNWKANGAGSTNTAGTITSTVSANTTSGFSIVTYTGTGANATVGHGLGVAPKMVIVQKRSPAGGSWFTYHANANASPASGNLYLCYTNAFTSEPTLWNSTAPTSSVFSLGTYAGANGSTQTFVAYCWAAVAGYSAFGSYTGNGSTDGTFVFCGFRPRYVLMKGSSVASHWIVYDTARNTYNAVNNELSPNNSTAENGVIGSGDNFDVLSNGFKLRSVVVNDMNVSGQTYIYAAFAENPLKYSLAR